MDADSAKKIYPDDGEIENEIADLERRLAEAKAKRQQLTVTSSQSLSHPLSHSSPLSKSVSSTTKTPPSPQPN
jgi:hypothetical protein